MSTTDFGALAVTDGYASAQAIKPYAVETLDFFTSGNIAVANRVGAAIVGESGTIVDVRAYLDTAPTGASAIFDVKINGVTAFTTAGNKPTIAAGTNASTTALPDVVDLVAGDRITVDVDQIGSGTTGAGLSLSVTIKHALTG